MIDVRRLIAMWCRVERQVFGSLVDAARRNGRPDGHHYCRPMMVDENERVESWQFIDKDVMRLMRKRLLEVNEQSTSMPEERIKSALMKKLYNLEWAVEAPKVPPMPLRGDPQFVAKQSAWRVAYCAAEKYQQTIYKFENIKANKRTNGGGSGCRYGAMNMHSHFYRGTVEFRLKEGTLEASEMIFWPLFCGWFVESCLHCSDAEALALDGLGGWVALMREKSLVQPSVLDWVEGKVKKC